MVEESERERLVWCGGMVVLAKVQVTVPSQELSEEELVELAREARLLKKFKSGKVGTPS